MAEVNTEGGAYIAGDVNVGRGDFVGGNKITIGYTVDEVAALITQIPSYDLSQTKPQRCDFYENVSLPRPPIARPELMAAIRNALLANPNELAHTSTIQINALHGMGGTGKSVIARTLCDEPEIQAAFPNGILWVTLGQTPDLLKLLRDWIVVLGGHISERVPSLDLLKNTLAILLKKRTCLLILDDVWKPSHAKMFLVGGPHCRFLLTTRDIAIANELGALTHSNEI